MKPSRLTLVGFAAVTVGAAAIAAVSFRDPAMSPAVGASEAGIPIAEVVHIHGIAVDRNDTSRLLLATHHGVYRTSADGLEAVLISENQNDYMGFSPHPADPMVIFASGHPVFGGNVGVIVSRDGGRTWEELADGVGGPVDFHAMSVSRADPNRIYGLYGAVQVSRDGGQTWTITGRPPGNTYDLAASAVDPDLVYAATASGIMISRDAGRTWESGGGDGRPATMVETAPDGTVFAFVVGSGLVKSPGTALSWSQIGGDFGRNVLIHLAIHPADQSRLYAIDDAGQILASVDGGASWRPFETARAADAAP